MFQLHEEIKKLERSKEKLCMVLIGSDRTAQRKRYHIQQIEEISENIGKLKYQIEILEKEHERFHMKERHKKSPANKC